MNQITAVASDHAGYQMKLSIVRYLKEKEIKVKNLGTDSEERVDYPDFGHSLASAVESGACQLGISICGSGNGINMTANKHQGIRGALCWTREIAKLARSHNDANICSIPARFIDISLALEIVNIFLETEFEGGRHNQRKEKIPINRQ